MISKQSSPTWFIVAFCIARITMGAFVRYLNKRMMNLAWPLPLSKLLFSITGPTLPILAHNMNVSLPEVNWAITVRQGCKTHRNKVFRRKLIDPKNKIYCYHDGFTGSRSYIW